MLWPLRQPISGHCRFHIGEEPPPVQQRTMWRLLPRDARLSQHPPWLARTVSLPPDSQAHSLSIWGILELFLYQQ